MTLETLDLQVEGNLVARPCTLDDVKVAVDFFRKQQVEENGKASETFEQLHVNWAAPHFKLESCTRGVFDENGMMVAFVEVWDSHETPVHPEVWWHILPEYRTEELGMALGQWGIQRAHQVLERVPENARVVIDSDARSEDKNKKALLEKLGFTDTKRSWWHMLIDMDVAPPVANWAEGITVTTMKELGRDEDVLRAVLESFKDHRGHVDQPFEKSLERWNYRISNDPEYDPSVYFLAMHGNKIVGVSLCRPKGWEDPDEAYVGTLGVIPAYRKRGIALALLHHTFGEFYKRGQMRVGLHVDGASLTGATRVYEKAGMRVDIRYDAYEMLVRDGVELSKQ